MEMRLGNEAAGDESTGQSGLNFNIGKRAPLAAALLAPAVLLGIWYFLTHGYESRRVTFAGFSSTSSGVASENSLFGFKGQTITIDYEVKAMPRGRFKIIVRRALDEPIVYRTISRTGKGRIKVKVPATGFYTIGCDGSPDGNGYDVTYKANWRVS